MIFFDSEIYTAALSGVSISENTPVIKYLSGVRYYDLGSTFNVGISTINYLNSDTFPNIQVQLSGDEFGFPFINLAGNALTGWTNAFDNAGASYNKSDWTIVVPERTVFYYIGYYPIRTYARTVDWVDGSWVSSNSHRCNVDTRSDNASRLFHDFNAETDRYTSVWGAWDSVQDLLIYDDTLGLQQFNSRLYYPYINFKQTTCYPDPTNQPNYIDAAGVRYYYCDFYHSGVSHSNGRFVFGDHNMTDNDAFVTEYFKIEISLNGVDWYDCCREYLGGELNPGDGCRVNPGVYSLDINNSIEFTLGTGKFTDIGTGPSGWGVYCRISMTANLKGASKYIGSIQEVTWL